MVEGGVVVGGWDIAAGGWAVSCLCVCGLVVRCCEECCVGEICDGLVRLSQPVKTHMSKLGLESSERGIGWWCGEGSVVWFMRGRPAPNVWGIHEGQESAGDRIQRCFCN